MRMQRAVLSIVFPAFLCYYTVMAHAALTGGGFSAPASARYRLAHAPGLVVPAGLRHTVSAAVAKLRQAVAAADSPGSGAINRPDLPPLWVDLEPAAASSGAVRAAAAVSPPGILPGQD